MKTRGDGLLMAFFLAVTPAATLLDAGSASTKSAVIDPATGCALPATPPLIIVLPSGIKMQATQVVYDLASRHITVAGPAPVFCNAFE